MSSSDQYEPFISDQARELRKRRQKLVGLFAIGCLLVVAYTSTSFLKVPTTQLADFQPVAGNQQVWIFQNNNYEGFRSIFGLGGVNYLSNIFIPQTSSFQVGQQVYVEFHKEQNARSSQCDHLDIIGPYNTPRLDAPAPNQQLSWNDKILNMQVFNYDADNEPRLQVFSYPDFQPYEGAKTFKIGKYNTQNLQTVCMNPGENKGISSMFVPDQLQITIYKQDTFQGESKVINGPAYIKLVDDLASWNDNIYSIEVVQQPLKINGYWERISGVNEEYTYTITTSTTFEDTRTTTTEITTSLSTGFSFGKGSASVQMSASVGQSVSDTISETLIQTVSTTHQINCSEKGAQVALWQWQMQGYRGGKKAVFIQDNNYQCVTHNKSPQCPVGYCRDQQCQRCKHFQ